MMTMRMTMMMWFDYCSGLSAKGGMKQPLLLNLATEYESSTRLGAGEALALGARFILGR
jgi:hypothetical protein